MAAQPTNPFVIDNNFTAAEVKRAVELLYAIGYGTIAADMGTVEQQDMVIDVASWVEWLDDHGHLARRAATPNR